jgi:hypothetical protein
MPVVVAVSLVSGIVGLLLATKFYVLQEIFAGLLTVAVLLAVGVLLVQVCSTQLVEMMDQMRNIVRRQKTKSDRISRADAANRFEFSGWQLAYYMSEVAVIRSPQRNQELPISILNSLHPHASGLVVARDIQRCLKRRSNESLVVVRGRINQMRCRVSEMGEV